MDEVTYSDGSKKEVNGFDVPVPALNEELIWLLSEQKENGMTTKSASPIRKN